MRNFKHAPPLIQIVSNLSAYRFTNTVPNTRRLLALDKPTLLRTYVSGVRKKTVKLPKHHPHKKMEVDFSQLSHADLISRCTKLERQVAAQSLRIKELTDAATVNGEIAPSLSALPKKPPKHVSRHTTRFIALKFSYLGHRYNGFEHANRCFTPLPTIEEVLWKALRKTRLINPPVPDGADESFEVIYDPKEREKKYYIHGKSKFVDDQAKERLEISWDGCQYSKCGRTDRGVSAFGQVIGIRVRSNAPNYEPLEEQQPQEGAISNTTGHEQSESPAALDTVLAKEDTDFDPIKDELPYVYMLNMILPPDIRILAWCPAPPEGFDARYSCLERRYKYFFTNPAFSPTPGPRGLMPTESAPAGVREGWLNIEKMKEAAKKLEGLHDYRNLCVIDASKQMPSCERRITFSDVEELESAPIELSTNPGLNMYGLSDPVQTSRTDNGVISPGPKVYAIVVHGSAFLWHQVRCIAAVLFLVGQGLESPDVIDRLLDITNTPGKPHYAMASDAPLVLWDCVFPGPEQGEKALDWIYAGDESTIAALTSKGDGKYGLGGVVDELWTQWQEAKLKEAQIGSLLRLSMSQGDESSIQRAGLRAPESVKARSQKVYEGAGRARLAGQYQPLMNRRLMDPLEVLNARYMATTKGAKRLAKREEANGLQS